MIANSTISDSALQPIAQINYGVSFAFDRTYNSSTTFFTIGTSLIGGNDFIPGSGNVVQEWDKYAYSDYTDRIISVSWVRETDRISSIASAYCDIVLNNYDDLFSSGNYILNGRPVRLFAGLNDEKVQVFVGATVGRPIIDEKSKTATYHCIDFLGVLMDRTVEDISGQANCRSDTALGLIFQAAGLLSTQYSLDIGYNYIPYFYVDSGTLVRDACEKVMNAEMGRLFMGEDGTIRFYNRQNTTSNILWQFKDSTNIVDADKPTASDITNVVNITANIRTASPNAQVWQLATPVIISGSSTLDVWADLSDPCSSIDTPVYYASATTSSYTVNEASDNSGAYDTNVTVSYSYLFGSTYKLTFTNAASYPLYITDVTLYGVAYTVANTAKVTESDSASVALYEEQPYDYETDFFESDSAARSRALVLLQDYASDIPAVNITVKGNPCLQLDDTVSVDLFGRYDTYKITRIDCEMAKGNFIQRLRVKKYSRRQYFTINQSQVGGSDYIAP